jgi:hypothetical protein
MSGCRSPRASASSPPADTPSTAVRSVGSATPKRSAPNGGRRGRRTSRVPRTVPRQRPLSTCGPRRLIGQPVYTDDHHGRYVGRLEREFLVHSYDVHTASGAHTSVVGPWATSALAKMYEGNDVVALEEAQDALVYAAIRSAVIAPVREVRRWFTGSDQGLDRLLQRDVVRELRAERDVLVTTTSSRCRRCPTGGRPSA